MLVHMLSVIAVVTWVYSHSIVFVQLLKCSPVAHAFLEIVQKI